MYRLTSSDAPDAQPVLRQVDGAIIPADPRNADYQTYLVWLEAGNTPEAAPPVSTLVPQVISRRQFFQRAALAGIITQGDALSAVATGAIPSALVTVIDGFPADQQFAAKMLVVGASEFNRDHPLTVVIGTALGMTAEQMDAFWLAAAAL